MKSFFQKLFKILLRIIKVITALCYGGIIIFYMLSEEVDKGSIWLYLTFLLFPLAFFLDRRAQKAIQHHRFRLRIYLSICFAVLEVGVVAIMPDMIKSFAYISPEIINGEGFFALLLFAGLLFLIYWTWWGKVSRNKADKQIIHNFRGVPNAVPHRDDHIISLIKSSEILKHKFLANEAGEYYQEYFPVMMTTQDGKIHFGAHYYDEQIKTSGSNSQLIHQTYRHAYWVIPVSLPDMVISKISRFDKTIGNTALNPDQMNFLKQVKVFMEKHEFVSLQVNGNAMILIRKYLPNLAALGESPIPVEGLTKMTEGLRSIGESAKG